MTMFRTVRRSLPVQYPRQSLRATFSTFPALLAHRAIVYTQTGNPSSVLTALTYPPLPPPPHDALNIRFRLSPINPSDLNVIEGVYPAKPAPVSALSPGHQLPEPVCVAGNEGLAEVLEVGSGVEGLSKGDWVVMAKQQAGTWSTTRTVESGDVVKLPSGSVSEVNGATMTVCALAICRTNCSSHSRCKGESADGVQYAEGLCGTQRGRLVSAKRCVHLSLRRSALMSSYIPIAGANSAVRLTLPPLNSHLTNLAPGRPGSDTDRGPQRPENPELCEEPVGMLPAAILSFSRSDDREHAGQTSRH